MVGEPKGDGQDERRGGGDEEEGRPEAMRSISRCMEGLLRWDRLAYARRSRRDLRERSPQGRSVAYARHRARAARAARSAGVVPYGSGRSPRSCAHRSRQRERRRGFRPYPGGRRSRSHARGRLDLVHTGHLASPNGAPAFTRIGGANTPGAAPRCSSRATIREAPVDTPVDPIAVVVQLVQSGRSPLRYASRLRVAWIVSIGGARC